VSSPFPVGICWTIVSTRVAIQRGVRVVGSENVGDAWTRFKISLAVAQKLSEFISFISLPNTHIVKFLSTHSCSYFLMGRKKWATNEKEGWLSERVPDFVQSQKDKTSSSFFAHIYSEFHKLWPYREPTEEEIEAQNEKGNTEEERERAKAEAEAKAKAIIFQDENKVSIIYLISLKSWLTVLKQQIYWWYFNHSRSTTSGSDTRNVLKLQGSNRILQPFQAYSQLYYELKIKPIIDKKYKEHLETVPFDEQKSAFAFRARVTKELLEAETEEVKREVEEYRRKKVSDTAIKIEDNDGQDDTSQAELAKRMQM
jgi:hypothetical protein